MANPQPDKYTKLSNELLEAIMKSDFSKRQLNILFLIWRCSYGFNKKIAVLKKSDFQFVGVYPGDITKELNYLQETKVIYWDEKNDLIAFNKNYDYWRISLSRAVVNGQADISKILKRQFKKLSKTLNLPVDNTENISKTLTSKKRKLSKTLNENNSQVSKTLNGQFSEPNSNASREDRKETNNKEINNVVVEQPHNNIALTYEKVFMRTISPFQFEFLQAYVEDDGMDEDVVIRAIEIAGENNAMSLKYVKTILDTWRTKKVKNIADAERAIKEFEMNKSSPNKSNVVNFGKKDMTPEEQEEYYHKRGYR